MEQIIVDRMLGLAGRLTGRPVRDGLSTGRDPAGTFWLWFRRSW